MRRVVHRLSAFMLSLVLLAGCGAGPAEAPEAVNTPLMQARMAAGIADCPATTTSPAAGPIAGGLPDLTLQCLGTGSESTLSGLRTGRPMVINMWAQWCGPCRDEAPVLAAVSKKTAGTVDFLGIDTADPQPELAIEFARIAGWTYPQLVDPEKETSKPPLSAPGLPHTVFVDKDGRIVGFHSGPILTNADLEASINDYFGIAP